MSPSCALLILDTKYSPGQARIQCIHNLDTCLRSNAAEASAISAQNLSHQGASSLYRDAEGALLFFICYNFG